MSTGNIDNNLNVEKNLLKDRIYLAKELKKSKCMLINERELLLQKEKEIGASRQDQEKLLNEYKMLESKLEKSLLTLSKNEEQITKLKNNIEDKDNRLTKSKELLEKKKSDLATLELKFKELERSHVKLNNEHTRLVENHEKLTNTTIVKLLLKCWRLKNRLKGVFKA